MPSTEAASAFARAERAFVAHSPDAGPALAAALAADPDLAIAHAVQGLGALSLARAELRPAARAALARAEAVRNPGGRATAYIAALAAWLDGSMRRSAACLEAYLADDPGDALALKLAHSIRFMAGDAPGMLRATASAVRRFPAGGSLGSFVLGCHAFALEEVGDYTGAETAGRAAVEADPADAWALHAVCHVHEMTGQAVRGAAWLESTRSHWRQCNNFGLHVAWHLALFRLEAGEAEVALDLYDSAVRPHPSDEYRDVANAVSLLVRLEQANIDVGSRWTELADHARRYAADDALVFAALHRLIAAACGGTADDLAALATQIAGQAMGTGDQAGTAARVGVRLAAYLCGRRPAAGDLDALLAGLPEIGGSHAQRDLFVRLLAQGAYTRGDWGAVRQILAYRNRNRMPDRFDGHLRARQRSAPADIAALVL